MELVFDERSAYSSLVEMIWHTHSERTGTFTSAAVSNWEMVIITFNGKTTITVRGPETKASEADFPADAEFFGITFKLGTFMPHLPLRTLLDRQDATLPEASSNSFWLHGSAWELPSLENADVFLDRHPSGNTRARSGGRGGDTGTHAQHVDTFPTLPLRTEG